MATAQSIGKVEFGDFQTPYSLAVQCCELLIRLGVTPDCIVEPTCGVGNFLCASASSFQSASSIFGLEINEAYASEAKAKLDRDPRVEVCTGSFFDFDWDAKLHSLAGHILVLGNPPWVTSSVLAGIGSSNLPSKRNIDALRGLDALTGKSNFDISESMLLKTILRLNGAKATMAVLCKTSVARKLLLRAWKTDVQCSAASLYKIDSMEHFGAAVDACLLVIEFAPKAANRQARIYATIGSLEPEREMGFEDGTLVSKVDGYRRNRHLQGIGGLQWRSGIKHDCSAIMELRKNGNFYTNGLGETVELEEQFLFPMYKSSEVANDKPAPSRWMLVPQQTIGQSTDMISRMAPKTWEYLQRYRSQLAARQSVIYKGRPDFSVFGVGSYTFAPWKVAISGLYKKLAFRVVGPYDGRPVVFDDTIYFLSFPERKQAEDVVLHLQTAAMEELLDAMIFWDAKRPITAEILNRLYIPDLCAGLLGYIPQMHEPSRSMSLF